MAQGRKPPPEPTTHLGVKVPVSMKTALDALATRRERPVTFEVVKAIDKHLKSSLPKAAKTGAVK